MIKASFYIYCSIILTRRTDEADQNKMFYVLLFSCLRQLEKLQSIRLSVSQSFGLNVWNMSVSKQDAAGTKIKSWKNNYKIPNCNLQSLALYATNEASVSLYLRKNEILTKIIQ